jgi:asparagine synthetase B (glutamine-hydrolysing)
MFAIRVEKNQPSNSDRRSPAPPSYSKCGGNGISVHSRISDTYGFCHTFDSGIVLGESLTTFGEERATKALPLLLSPTEMHRLLKDDTLTLIVVNWEKKQVTITATLNGSRPCYYTIVDGVFYCSSSIRAMAELGVELAVDNAAFGEFMVYRYTVPPRTLYKEIHKLAGGQRVSVDLESGKIIEDDYRDFPDITDSAEVREDAVIDRFDSVMRGELTLMMSHASRPGLLLSGGLDSSLMGAVAVALNPKVKSVSSGFSFLDPHERETEYAVSMAQKLGLQHHLCKETRESYLQGLVESVYHTEAPIHHLQSVLLYLLFKSYARDNHDLMLCGLGADAIFGNGDHMKYFKHQRLISLARATGAQAIYGGLIRTLGVKSRRWNYFASKFGRNLQTDQHMLWTLEQYGTPDLVSELFGIDYSEIVSGYRSLMFHYSDYSPLTRITIQSFMTSVFAGNIVWGKLAESQSLRIHYPYQSQSIIAFGMGIPWELRLQEPKHLIRVMLRRYGVPEEFIRRPKMSFGFSYQHWAPEGALLQPIVDMAGEMFDKSMLRSLQSEEPGRAMILWNVLNYYLWRKLCIERISPEIITAEVLSRHRALQKHG